MVEADVVTQSLSQEMIAAGAEFTRKLDEKLSISAALWLLMPDTQSWRFVVSIPGVEKVGPKKFYSTIQKILTKMSPTLGISLSDVSVFPPSHPLIQVLKTTIGTGPNILGIHLARNTVQGQFIEGAYIYRMHFPAAA